MSSVPVLDIGGSHVTAARVDLSTWTTVQGTRHRQVLDAHGTATDIIARLAAAARTLAPFDQQDVLCVAIPGPFDHTTGFAYFQDVGKFDALYGIDLRQALTRELGGAPLGISFVHDATAFAVGEWLSGAARGQRKVAAITLGTGIGSAFLDDGHPTTDGPSVPLEGRVDLLRLDGTPLEDHISTRAITRAYGGVSGVKQVTDAARQEDNKAIDVINTAFAALARALAPWLKSFGAETLVVGGSMVGSWDVIKRPLREGLNTYGSREVNLCVSANPESSVEAGAAWLCSSVA